MGLQVLQQRVFFGGEITGVDHDWGLLDGSAGKQHRVARQARLFDFGFGRLIGPKLMHAGAHGLAVVQGRLAKRGAGGIGLATGAQQGWVSARKFDELLRNLIPPGDADAFGIALHVPLGIARTERAQPDRMRMEQLGQLRGIAQGMPRRNDVGQFELECISQRAKVVE